MLKPPETDYQFCTFGVRLHPESEGGYRLPLPERSRHRFHGYAWGVGEKAVEEFGLALWPYWGSWEEKIERRCSEGAMAAVEVPSLSPQHPIRAVDDIGHATPRLHHLRHRRRIQMPGGFEIEILLILFNGRLQRIIEIIMGLGFGRGTAQVSKHFKVFLEPLDAFRFVSLARSLKIHDEPKRIIRCSRNCSMGNRKRKRTKSMVNDDMEEESLGAMAKTRERFFSCPHFQSRVRNL